ncbi:unnamed protein product [Ectocarpus sp. CCAP 1310/34]|nr:unnamed protein product [Ectocarpus sp. CCAP 1310/34]
MRTELYYVSFRTNKPVFFGLTCAARRHLPASVNLPRPE